MMYACSVTTDLVSSAAVHMNRISATFGLFRLCVQIHALGILNERNLSCTVVHIILCVSVKLVGQLEGQSSRSQEGNVFFG